MVADQSNLDNWAASGFCKDIFRELHMEFAVEAQKLLAVSLEHSVGRPGMPHDELVSCYRIPKGRCSVVEHGQETVRSHFGSSDGNRLDGGI
ncbi:MAG: hypothetical protein JNM34_00225 [Chthonomonadaceae bacterium]|nr:hypothetical protein [Chthonomonadaceae bacterium]